MTRTGSELAVGMRWWLGVGAIGVAAGGTTLIARDARAQVVTLRIGPPVGETMRMRLDQRVEMSGTARMPWGDSTATVVTTLLVISRAFVEGRDHDDATIVLASTDSVAASSSGADSTIVATETRRALQGKQVRLRIAPDGATEIIGRGPGGGTELNALFSQMPATLPETAIEVGQSWSRAMVAPLGGSPGYGSTNRAGGKLQATFRLDSLSGTGESAYVSLVGTLTRPPSRDTSAATLTMSGSLTGSLVIDRRRGWITEARMTYVVRSLMTPPPGSRSTALRFRMKMTQWMRAVG
jgi:hypothetical protein